MRRAPIVTPFTRIERPGLVREAGAFPSPLATGR